MPSFKSAATHSALLHVWANSPRQFALYGLQVLGRFRQGGNKRGAGFGIYWRMLLHVLAVSVVSIVVKYALHWVFDASTG